MIPHITVMVVNVSLIVLIGFAIWKTESLYPLFALVFLMGLKPLIEIGKSKENEGEQK